MAPNTNLPRGSLFALALVHAAIMGVSARMLPWPAFSVFAALALLTAVLHAAVAGLALVGHARLALVWRAASFASLAFLGYVTYAALSSGLYVARLYAGVGVPLAAAALAAWCVVAFFTLPIACWGLAKTGGLLGARAKKKLPRDAGPLAVAVVSALSAFGAASHASTSRATELLEVSPTRPLAIEAALTEGLRVLRVGPTGDASLFVPSATVCEREPGPGYTTIFATYLLQTRDPVSICVQRPSLDDAAAELGARLRETWGGGPIAIDVATGTQPLPDSGALLGAVLLRPGSDGACLGRRCLVPWQLVATDQFTRLAGFAALQLRVGISAPVLRQSLGGLPLPATKLDLLENPHAGFAGISRLETQSFLRHPDGRVVRSDRLLGEPPPLDRASLLAATQGALGFAAGAQEPDGRFHYLVNPFTAEVSNSGFNVPRQAGTTLALCDAGALDPRSRLVATKSLGMLATLEEHKGELGSIVYPPGSKGIAPLGNTALSMVAFLACRERVGPKFDAVIERLGNGLLASQRPDGGFYPSWDPNLDQPRKGQDQLYAAGQAVLALVLWESAKDLPKPAGLGQAIDRAMDYFAGPYWSTPLHDFFYLEENWHCLAARAAVGSGHRRDAYERFCIEYMTMKSRMVMDETSGVDDEFVGAYGFGDVLPPHHAATAGFAEALAAMMAVKHARKESTEKEERTLSLTLRYMLRNQWREDNCTFCTRSLRVVGGFSENVGSPVIRIDFVQHALAALSHGGRELGLLGADEVAGPT